MGREGFEADVFFIQERSESINIPRSLTQKHFYLNSLNKYIVVFVNLFIIKFACNTKHRFSNRIKPVFLIFFTYFSYPAKMA